MQNPNFPRIGFRPNMYSRGGRHSMIPPPRPAVPTSINRMLKPGFEPQSSTSYNRIPAKPTPPEKSSVPEKIFEPYPILTNFMFTDEELTNTPSHRIHNISFDDEITLRRVGTFSIRELARRLNAPYEDKRYKISARAICVAMIYFHRFYMYHSLTTFDPTQLGTACLFLAAKCEECPRKLSHFSKQLYSIMHPDQEILEDFELDPMNDLITTMETSVLRTLGFELKIDLPHVDVIQAGFPTPGDRLRKVAYTFATDILVFTTLCIQHESKTLAAACFFVAAAFLDVDMQNDFGDIWYTKIDENLTEATLVKVVKAFTDAMQEVKPLIRAERVPRPDAPKPEPHKVQPSEHRSQHTPTQHSSNREHPHSSEHRSHQKLVDSQKREHSGAQDARKSHDPSRKHITPSQPLNDRSRHGSEQKIHPKNEIEAPLLLPPPLPPPNSEFRKRKTPLMDEIPQKRPSDPSHFPTFTKHSHRPGGQGSMDFTIPPPQMLPPPQDRRQSMPVRGDPSSYKSSQPSSSNSHHNQSGPYDQRRRDEARLSMPHPRHNNHGVFPRPPNNYNPPNALASNYQQPQQPSHQHSHQQKDERKREMMQKFVPAAQSSASNPHNSYPSRRPPFQPPTAAELEEGEIE